MTFVALEDVPAGGTGNRVKARSRFLINPTVGVSEVSVDLGFKVRKVLARQARRSTFRLYIHFFHL
jgi:hypothetical protein